MSWQGWREQLEKSLKEKDNENEAEEHCSGISDRWQASSEDQQVLLSWPGMAPGLLDQ